MALGGDRPGDGEGDVLPHRVNTGRALASLTTGPEIV
jgi:hypothetical protein